MLARRRFAWLLLPALLLGGLVPARAADVIRPKVVDYKGLGQAVKELKGKVVVVDFWRDDWLICKKEFPHLVQMQSKYGKDGLAAMAVSLDDPADANVMKSVQDFLTRQKATFRTFVLNEKPEVWQEKLKIDGPPAVFVFDREGKPRKFAPADYEEVEKYVAGLMKK